MVTVPHRHGSLRLRVLTPRLQVTRIDNYPPQGIWNRICADREEPCSVCRVCAEGGYCCGRRNWGGSTAMGDVVVCILHWLMGSQVFEASAAFWYWRFHSPKFARHHDKSGSQDGWEELAGTGALPARLSSTLFLLTFFFGEIDYSCTRRAWEWV